jgi:transcriptional regulator with XRE-family HTH domain
MVPGDGTRRRVEALAILGWTRREIAARAGLSVSTLRPVNLRRKVYKSTASAVARVYEELRLQTPRGWQAERIAAMSRDMGYVPGWAWKTGDIDRHSAQPNLSLVENKAWRKAIQNRQYPI